MNKTEKDESVESVTVNEGHHCEARDLADDPQMFAAYLWYDGYVSVDKPTEFVPITDPFYTSGRPEREAVPGGTCDCLSVGGIPILSERLYDWLCFCGADGETAELIYRGHNKRAYDTVQEGYRRFLPSPVYRGIKQPKLIAELPHALPAVFAIHTDFHVKFPKPGIQTEYHIGLSLEALEQLTERMPGVLVVPLLLSSR